MERNDAKSSARIQQVDHTVNGLLQHVQLPIQFNPNCLKRALCRMSAGGTHLCRDRAADNILKLKRRLDGLLRSRLHDMLCDVLCEAVFSVIPDHPV